MGGARQDGPHDEHHGDTGRDDDHGRDAGDRHEDPDRHGAAEALGIEDVVEDPDDTRSHERELHWHDVEPDTSMP